MSREVTPNDEGVPQPTKRLSGDQAVVMVPEEGFFEPSDLDIPGEDWDEAVDGPIPDYDPERIQRELDEAAAEGEVS